MALYQHTVLLSSLVDCHFKLWAMWCQQVNVNKEASCGGQEGQGRQVWQEAFTQVNLSQSVFLTASSSIMFTMFRCSGIQQGSVQILVDTV